MSKEFNEAERALIAQISAKEQPTVLVDVDYYQTIIDDPEVSGLHCFYKRTPDYESAGEGSFVGWLKDKYGFS
ncbi:MAG: hypothetical protein AAFQ73_14585 [Pseudomonadota bacterium]